MLATVRRTFVWNLNRFMACMLGTAVTVVGTSGCGPAGGGANVPDATDNGNDNGGGTETGTLSVDFGSASGGNLAVAEDADGNQYSFRAKEVGGQTVITEANVLLTDGTGVKCSLDDQGRPVKLRASDNENADISYAEASARIRYTSANGETNDVGGIDSTAAKAAVRARRNVQRDKRNVLMQANESSNVQLLRDGLSTFEETIESLFQNENNPAAGTTLEEAARRVGDVVSMLDIDEVDGALDEIEIDDVPEVILALAGQTYVLFDAEGACVDQAGLENELTFDQFGILLTEHDRNFVFPDFSLGGANRGFTINYDAGTPVDLTGGEELEFSAMVTPVFTGTQLDMNGNITIERRFLAQLTFEVDLFTVAEASAELLFNAALINGSLDEDGGILEFDLILVNLMEDAPVEKLGRVRYHRQGTPPPADRQFDCDLQVGRDAQGELECPLQAAKGQAFEVALVDGPESQSVQYDWFVADGFGFVEGAAVGPQATIVPTGDGILEVNVVVSDPTSDDASFNLYACEVRVGEILVADELIDCLEFWTVDEPGTLFLNEGVLDNDVVAVDWDVRGTDAFDVLNESEGGIELVFFEPGFFEVLVEITRRNGGSEIGVCEIDAQPGDLGFDICEANGWYGDDFCDDFCPMPDPDCEGTLCDPNDFPGDGFCDLHCDLFDVDCLDAHLCKPTDFPGDGFCDEKCDLPDPDCSGLEPLCESFDFPGDGFCDELCDLFDPDCQFEHLCDPNDFPGDGHCDQSCDLPDPDCDDGHLCDPNDFPGDGFCDQSCDLFDPDCDLDHLCDPNDFPGDGFCDQACDQFDPDCEDESLCDPSDVPGDGVCDAGCQLADPDCNGVTITNDAVICLELMTAEQPGIFFLSDAAPVQDATERLQWDVFGTENFEMFAEVSAEINFFEAGTFRVQLTAFLLDGSIEISTCEVIVSPPAEP